MKGYLQFTSKIWFEETWFDPTEFEFGDLHVLAVGRLGLAA